MSLMASLRTGSPFLSPSAAITQGERKGLPVHPQMCNEHPAASERMECMSQGPGKQKLTIQVRRQQIKQEPSVRKMFSSIEL